MVQNVTIISPLSLPWNWSADYQRQTLVRLARTNRVILYDQHRAHFFIKKPPTAPSSLVSRPLSVHTPRYVLPLRSVPLIERLNRLLSFWWLLFLHRREAKIVWIFDPFFAFMTRALPTRLVGKTLVVYDCVDFHAGHPSAPVDTTKLEQTLITRSHTFFVNSHTLYTLHSPQRTRVGKKTWLVPQGFDQTAFAKTARTRSVTLPFAKKQPLIGYVGGINARLDWKLLKKLVANNPQWNFGFWGPIQDEAGEKGVHMLRHFPHFFYAGSLPRHQLSSVMQHFSVGIIPYTPTTDFNRYSYPMKVLEYFYLGKPVISTPIEELKRFPAWVKTARTARDWQKQVQSILRAGWPVRLRAQQKQTALHSNWERKLEAITAALKREGHL